MKKRITLFSVLFAVLISTIIYTQFSGSTNTDSLEETDLETVQAAVAKEIQYRFGLPVDSFEVLESVVKSGESFGNILLSNGVGYDVINRIANDFKDVFDVRWLRSGKPYALFCQNNDSSRVARYMVYESSPIEYYVFDLSDSVNVYQGKKEVTTKVHEVSGAINSSLYETLMERGASVGVADRKNVV